MESQPLDHSIEFEFNLDLEYLQAELSRIDVLLQYHMRRWQLAGQDPADAFRGLYISEAEVEALLAHPLGSNWGQTVTLPPAEAEAFARAANEADHQVQALVELAQEHNYPLRLQHLAAVFGLSSFELDTLLIGLAPALDVHYERLYSYLQDDVTRKRPTVNLVLNLLCDPGPERLLYLSHFAEEAPLVHHRLLKLEGEAGPLLNQVLTVDESIIAWLLGHYRPSAELAGRASWSWPGPDPSDHLLAAQVQPELASIGAERPLVVFYGADHTAQAAAARLLAVEQQRPLLRVELSQGGESPLPLLRLALRDARLTGAIPYLSGWDSCLVEGVVPPDLLTTLCAYPALVIVAGTTAWQASGIRRERRLLWLEFPIPAYAQRLALWEHFLKNVPTAHKLDLVGLSGQFLLTGGQIRDAVAATRDIAAQYNRPLHNEDLFSAVRAHSNPRLATLARKITPRYDWPDIILPRDQMTLLREIVATVRQRPQVLNEWGVGQKLASSRGVTILFAGEPGTGKTMAAEIIARELGLDLYKIDLSTIVSKYIGETEKNLEKIFSEAQSSNAILFFDEADAIFGKRSEVKDAHDRYANIEVSYLLQRMEAYDGVTILATNLRANLDEAFTRRLQFAVDFPFPEKGDRLRIWQTLFPPNVPREADIDFKLLAGRFKLAGGNIRNIIVGAAYLAAADGGQVSMSHLFHSTRRELQKMGRLVNEEDLAPRDTQRQF